MKNIDNETLHSFAVSLAEQLKEDGEEVTLYTLLRHVERDIPSRPEYEKVLHNSGVWVCTAIAEYKSRVPLGYTSIKEVFIYILYGYIRKNFEDILNDVA